MARVLLRLELGCKGKILASVSGVVRAFSGGDLAVVETAARASRMSPAVDADLERTPPKTVLGMGERAHRAFDDLAWAGQGGASNALLLTRLDDVMSHGIVCHAVVNREGVKT